MGRWLIRLAGAGLVISLLGYLWSRANQEYDEDDLEDEFDLDFETPFSDSLHADPFATVTSVETPAPAETVTQEMPAEFAAHGEFAAAMAPAEDGVETVDEPGHDDLTLVVGIGAVFQKRLNAAGITTFRQLAEASPADLHAPEIDGINVDSWIQQARELAEQQNS
ncbi:MAG: hypothetical protein ACR2M0_16695 [Chloroflexia bacterium]